jgi:hypothetical protein
VGSESATRGQAWTPGVHSFYLVLYQSSRDTFEGTIRCLSFFLYLSFFLSVVLELSCNLQNNFLTPKRHFHVPKFCCLPHRLGWELFVYLSLNIGIAFRESDGEGTNVAGYDEAPVGLAIFHRGRVSGLLSLSNAGLLVIERLAHIR